MCKKRISIFVLLALAFASPAQAVQSITIMADSSMSAVVSVLARNYSAKNNIVVGTSFANQATQEAQILEGSAADIIITPKLAWIDSLKQQGLVDANSLAVIARGRLALVGPEDSPINLLPQEDFPTTTLITRMNFEPGFVVGYPEILVEGVYAKDALISLGAFSDIEPYMLYVKDRNEMLSMVEAGNYGLLLYGNALERKHIKILALMPDKVHRPIDFYGVAVAGENMTRARSFLAYMKSPDAKIILSRFGFYSGS